jgi:hypothetical protein
MEAQMPPRWECRYSSCEMLYLELRDDHIVTFLDHAPNNVERFPFTEVLAGQHDAMINMLFGENALPQIKAAIAQHQNPPPVLTKDQLRELHRRESN